MDVLGIETRADAWSMVHLKGSAFKVKVERFVSLPGDGFEERMGALSDYVSQRKLRNARIALGLPRESSLSMVLDIPAPRAEAIEGILNYELEKHVPFDPSNLSHGFQVLKKEGRVFSILLAAAREELVQGIVDRFSAAGLAPACVTTWHAALFNALYFSNKLGPEKNVAFIGMNGRALTLDVFSGLIPVYSKNLARPGDKVERREWLPLIERELRRSVLGMTGPLERRRLDECILISDEEPDEEFLGHLSEEITIPVKSQGLKELGLPGTAAPALGAALGLLGKGRVMVNIAPTCHAQRRRGPRLNTLALAIVVSILAFSTGASYLLKDWTTMRGLEAAMTELRAKKSVAQKLVEREKEIYGKIETLEKIDGRTLPGPLAVLTELSTLLPADTWLTGMDYNGGTVSIEGYSARASRLLMILSKSRYMKDFEFAGPVAKAPNGKERFRMNFKLRPYAGSVSGTGRR